MVNILYIKEEGVSLKPQLTLIFVFTPSLMRFSYNLFSKQTISTPYFKKVIVHKKNSNEIFIFYSIFDNKILAISPPNFGIFLLYI